MLVKFLSEEAKSLYNNQFEGQTEWAAGVDLRIVSVDDDGTIHTGVSVEIPNGYVGLMFIRSSLGINYGVSLANSVGVIDSDYRGEIMSRLSGIDNIMSGWVVNEVVGLESRFAQLVVVPCVLPRYAVVDELSDTTRGTGGIGSTGLK